jgi:murein DD-endopeptidase MepM/ murein hydrolase activator NlpD
MDNVVGEVEGRAERMDRSQRDILGAIGDAALDEIARSRKAVAMLGLDAARFGKNALSPAPLRRPAPLDDLQLRDVGQDGTGSAIGGPLLPPVEGRKGESAFEADIQRAEEALESAAKARNVLRALPLGRPIAAGHDVTSGFGTRLDPFTRSPALHSGVDFRAPTGTPVRAVAAGKIIEAGYNGGYGRMVEIDHGFGITTRYAHLYSIAVNEGDRIEKGALLGSVGSTGRSTGPHLHYEVRLDDDATDPMRFVRAQALLAGN